MPYMLGGCGKCGGALGTETDELGLPDVHCMLCGWRATRAAAGADDPDSAQSMTLVNGEARSRRRNPSHGKMRLA